MSPGHHGERSLKVLSELRTAGFNKVSDISQDLNKVEFRDAIKTSFYLNNFKAKIKIGIWNSMELWTFPIEWSHFTLNYCRVDGWLRIFSMVCRDARDIVEWEKHQNLINLFIFGTPYSTWVLLFLCRSFLSHRDERGKVHKLEILIPPDYPHGGLLSAISDIPGR